jgi:hypothetical protein
MAAEPLSEVGESIDRVGPFEHRGHWIEGRVRSGNVSSGGAAIAGNATWYLWVDGVEVSDVVAARADDAESWVRTMLIWSAEDFLDAAGPA